MSLKSSCNLGYHIQLFTSIFHFNFSNKKWILRNFVEFCGIFLKLGQRFSICRGSTNNSKFPIQSRLEDLRELIRNCSWLISFAIRNFLCPFPQSEIPAPRFFFEVPHFQSKPFSPELRNSPLQNFVYQNF